tara:strand:- start:5982 stop:6293 length:312 start_codon:yes stop_codon:yes gene_type:complete
MYKISKIDDVVPIPANIRKTRVISNVRTTLEGMRPGQHATIKQKENSKTFKRFVNSITHLCYTASNTCKENGINIRFLKVPDEQKNCIDIWCIAGKTKQQTGE